MEQGAFEFEDGVQLAKVDGPFNKAVCFFEESDSMVGKLTEQCLSDFTGCDQGYSINVWISIRNHSMYHERVKVFSFGDIKLSVVYYEDIALNPKADVEWKHDKCLYTFELPRESWTFISVHLNQTNMAVYLNGLLHESEKQCEVPELNNADDAALKTGEAPFCMDDLSVIKMNEEIDLENLYYKLISGNI